MAITRINNNQITDAIAGNLYVGINAAAKLQNYSITSQKISNNLTYGSDLTISGNLTVQGNVTAIDTIDLVVEDPLILLAKDQTGAPTLDIGFIGERGSDINIAFIWDESADEFATVFTNDAITNTIVTIDSYASLHVANITASNANITGNVTFSGNIVGNLSVSGNVNGGNLNSNAAVTGVTITASGNLEGNNATITNAVSSATVTASGNILGGNVNSNAAVTGVTITASGNLEGNNATITNAVNTATLDASGNIVGGNVNSNAAVTGVTITASGNLEGNNATITNAVSTATVNASGNVLAGNLNANTNVTGLTITASGNLEGNNAVITNGVSSTTVNATGNVQAGNVNSTNIVSAVTVNATTVEASGNLAGGNANIGNGVYALTGTFGGNVSANYFFGNGSQLTGIDATQISSGNSNIKISTANGNAVVNIGGTSNVVVFTTNSVDVTGAVNATGNVVAGNVTSNATVSGVTVTASGNVNGGNAVVTGDVSAATGTFSGNVGAGNLNSAAAVNAVTVTASGNLVGGNANVTAGVFATTVTASGNVNGGNINTNSIVGTDITVTGANVNFALSGNLDMGQRWINDLADPVQAFDAATKQYVDDQVSAGLTIHTPVYLESPTPLAATYAQGGTVLTVTDTVAGNVVVFSTAANLQPNDQLWFSTSFEGIVANVAYFVVSTPNTSAAVLSTAYDGVPVGNITGNTGLSQSVRVNSGIGATLTNSGANVALVVDGVTVTGGERILVYEQVNGAQNGVYDVTVPGDAGNAWVLTRSSDTNTYGPKSTTQLDAGDYFFIQAGNTGAGESYVLTAPTGVIIIGYSPLTFTQFSASSTYSAGNGLSLNGTVFSVNVDDVTTAIVADAVVVKAGANLTTPNIGDATGNSLTLGGNGLLSATTVSVTGNVSGANINATTGVYTVAVDASGNIVGGNLNSNAAVTGVTITASGNLNGGNAVVTGDVSGATGTFSGNVDGGNINATTAVNATTITASGNLVGGNANITNGVFSSTVTASGNVLAGNLNSNAAVTGVTITASGNLNGGNAVITGDVSAATGTFSGNVSAANVAAGNVSVTGNVSGAGAVFSGNVTAQNFIGNISGNIDAGGANTNIQFNDDNILNGSAAFTFDKTSNLVTVSGNLDAGNLITLGVTQTATVNASGNVLAGNLNSNAAVTGVTITASGNLEGNNATITNGVSATTVTATGNVDGGNITTGGEVVATGNVSGGNINSVALVSAATVVASGNITGGNITTAGQANLGNIVISGDTITGTNGQVLINSAGDDVNFIVSGDTQANLLVVDAGSDTVLIGTGTPTTNAALKIGTTNSILIPVGNTAQRPGTAVTGMVRFNTTLDVLEFYDSNSWTPASSEFTVITADEFNGDGSTVAFTLSADSTTAGTVVAINGVVQIPTTAYSVSGTTLTFTEAPEVNDVIDARIFTTTTTVTSLSNAGLTAVVETLSTADVEITGNLIPASNTTYDLGSTTRFWNDLYLAGNSIYLGTIVIKDVGANQIGFFQADGTTPATIDADNVDTTQIASGTSSVSVVSTNGNLRSNVAGVTVQTISPGLVAITGDLSVTGNATLSGNILGDRVQNGTTSFDIQTPNGNANITVGGTSNVAVFSTAGANVAGTLGVTGNITGGNLSGTSIVGTLTTAVQTNITSVGTLGSLTVTGNIGGGNLSVSTGTVTLGGIVNANANGVGNIGSSTTYFNTVFAKATSAQYADLAEMYEADMPIEPGTVVCFGGAKEVTLCEEDACRRIAGVVSTNPSYLMNSGQTGEYVVAIALQGRVPVKVTGIVRKGDMMVATSNGRARAEANPQVGAVIGKALADFDGQDGVIEVVIGRV
jgi:filamentous hemagglutinin